MTTTTPALTLVDLLPVSDTQSWEQAACKGDPNHDAWFPYPSQDFAYVRGIRGHHRPVRCVGRSRIRPRQADPRLTPTPREWPTPLARSASRRPTDPGRAPVFA